MQVMALISSLAAVAGVAQQVLGTVLVRRFVTSPAPVPQARPPVSILKPLCGVEPLTEQALESCFLFVYPHFQLVFGVQSPNDPVLQTLKRLQARYPAQDVAVVVDATLHGSNRKVSNLINMQKSARYELLVMSDADIHVPPYFLDSVMAALEAPGVGLVTSLYTGLPGSSALATRLGVCQINYSFLPGALLARHLGRQDCLGVTMALKQSVLAEIGGLAAVKDRLADDQVLGRLVVARGYKLTLTHVIPATTVPEADFRALFRHELRWARTIRALVPLPWAASVLQISLLWAVLALLFSSFALWAWCLAAAVLLSRLRAAHCMDSALRLPPLGGALLFLLRDCFSTLIYVASFTGSRVDWRGQMMQADAGTVN